MNKRDPFALPKIERRHQGFLIEVNLCKRLHNARRQTGLSLTTIIHNALRAYLPTIENPSGGPNAQG